MSLMHFREPNQVKWMGVRPGHNGEQVLAYDTVINGAQVVYTVPAGKVFFLCEANLLSISNVTGKIALTIYDAAPALLLTLGGISMIVAQSQGTDHYTYWPPIELPAGYSIRVESNIAGLEARSSIFGWIEDA